MSQTPHSKTKIYLLFAIIIFVWGLSWPVGKLGLQYIPSIWYAGYRLLIGALSMFVVVIVMGKFILPRKADIPIILTMGLLQMGLFMLLINIGLSHVDAGRSAVLVYTTPLWVMPLSLFFKERAGLLKWLGFVLGMAGVIVLFGPWGIDWSNHLQLMGNGILLLASLCWAISILCARYMKWPHSPLELTPWQLLLGTIPVMAVAFFAQPHAAIHWNHVLIFSLLYNGVLSTAFAYWGTMLISKELPSVTVSLSLLVIPLVGLLFSVLLLHEPITLSFVLAIIFIVGGLCSVALEKKDNKLS